MLDPSADELHKTGGLELLSSQTMLAFDEIVEVDARFCHARHLSSLEPMFVNSHKAWYFTGSNSELRELQC